MSEQYRNLEPGELVQDGDESQLISGAHWTKLTGVLDTKQHSFRRYRRPIPQSSGSRIASHVLGVPISHNPDHLTDEQELREERHPIITSVLSGFAGSVIENQKAEIEKLKAAITESERLHALTKGELAALRTDSHFTEFERNRARGYEDGFVMQSKEIAELRAQRDMLTERAALLAKENIKIRETNEQLVAKGERLLARLDIMERELEAALTEGQP
jgi:hypothetical protein